MHPAVAKLQRLEKLAKRQLYDAGSSPNAACRNCSARSTITTPTKLLYCSRNWSKSSRRSTSMNFTLAGDRWRFFL
jgi:hypothetical protein